jgi:hypothetical protein
VVKAQDVTPDTYEVTGLDDGKKLAVARRDSDGESIAYGNVDPVSE